MKVFSVSSVTVTVIAGSSPRLYVEVWGQAATSGWKNPELDGAGDTSPTDAVHELSFEADRPTGIVLQVLTPIYAATEIDAKHGADAVIVEARTNRITVHASDFVTGLKGDLPRITFRPFPVTTMALGEEIDFTTLRLGEEAPFTTFAVGEETPTLRIGEDPPITTLRLGEEGPTTNPQLDDPAGPLGGPFGRF